VKRTIGIEVDVPESWDEGDFEFLMEELEKCLSRSFLSRNFSVEEYR